MMKKHPSKYALALKAAILAVTNNSEFSRQMGEKNPQNVQSWIARNGVPAKKAGKASRILGVPAHTISEMAEGMVGENETPYLKSSSIHGSVPLISSVQAGDFCEAIDNFHPGDAESWVPCPAQHSSKAFALKIEGDSMFPRFQAGEIVIVDPEVTEAPGKFVIAKRESDQGVTLKQLVFDDGNYFLKAINPKWPDSYIKLSEEWHICGVVICKVELF